MKYFKFVLLTLLMTCFLYGCNYNNNNPSSEKEEEITSSEEEVTSSEKEDVSKKEFIPTGVEMEKKAKKVLSRMTKALKSYSADTFKKCVGDDGLIYIRVFDDERDKSRFLRIPLKGIYEGENTISLEDGSGYVGYTSSFKIWLKEIELPNVQSLETSYLKSINWDNVTPKELKEKWNVIRKELLKISRPSDEFLEEYDWQSFLLKDGEYLLANGWGGVYDYTDTDLGLGIAESLFGRFMIIQKDKNGEYKIKCMIEVE